MPPLRSLRTARAEREDQVLNQLRAVVGELSASARSLEGRTGITNAQLFVLQALARAGEPLPIGALQREVRSGQSAVSLLVSRLERSGLVRRAVADGDRRSRVVTLTPKGARLARLGPVPPLARVMRALAALPDAQLRALGGGLAALAEGLGASGEPLPLFEAPPGKQRAR